MLPYVQKFKAMVHKNEADEEENAALMRAMPTYTAIAANLREPLITN